MAKIEEFPKIHLELVVRLSEDEARFLEGMAGFDHQAVAEAIAKVCGTHYTGSANGLYSLLETAKGFAGPLQRLRDARDVFCGARLAVPK
jgi:hypothetical protein